MCNEINNCSSFPQYLELSKKASNKVGFLVLCFERLHPHATSDDLINLGGRIAKLWVLAHKDTGYLLELIWITSARHGNGSHLNYIQAIVCKKPVNNNQNKSNYKPKVDML